MKQARLVLLLMLAVLLWVFYLLAREQFGLSEWQRNWRSQGQLPTTALPWQNSDPNALEMQIARAIARVQQQRGVPQEAQDVDAALQTILTLRPGWPYYLLLAQQWQLAQGQLQPDGWLRVLRAGVYEPAISQFVARVLFQNWTAFTAGQRQQMLALLWRSGSRNQGQLINSAFLSSRLFDYCDYGYNTALDVPPDCYKAGWRPLKKSPQTEVGGPETN